MSSDEWRHHKFREFRHLPEASAFLSQRDLAATNERVIIITGLFGKKIKSLNLKTISDISLTEKSDGRGTITFGSTNVFSSFFGGNLWPGMGQNNVPSFELIENAKVVYEKIRKEQSK